MASGPPKVLQASRAAGGIKIDGRLDEPAWADARGSSPTSSSGNRWKAHRPRPGPKWPIVYDDDALYIGARMHSLGPDDLSALMTRRDNGGNAERIVFSIDSYRDRRTAYSFGVTATGVRVDYYQPSDQEHSRDYSWDPGLAGPRDHRLRRLDGRAADPVFPAPLQRPRHPGLGYQHQPVDPHPERR